VGSTLSRLSEALHSFQVEIGGRMLGMCYIICMSSSVCVVLSMHGGLRGGGAGGKNPPTQGFGGSALEKFFLPQETVEH
jgi:hypothetical protein